MQGSLGNIGTPQGGSLGGAQQGGSIKSSPIDFERALSQQLSTTGKADAIGDQAIQTGGNFLTQMVQDTQNRYAAATQATQNVFQSGGVGLHSAMIAMEEASISFQMLVEMRNKVVESLQEVMRMQV
ncbi:MAG: flagellar hook-basal body complex protein FliE [Verrucomicrobiae bacterium]|nr:flagellar hook-basal body complex protein FliE [Verrucomicrobiae bacterium]